MKMNIIWKKRVSLGIRYLLLTAVGLIMIYPMIWMVGASFKASNNEIFSSIGFIPAHPTFEAYRKGWKSTETVFATYMLNTYKFVIPKVIGTVLSATITAYGFSRFQ
jgi:oligogalacturonide transport system permease protein